MKPPQMPAAESSSPAGMSRARPNATGRITTTPIRNTNHERSVSDSMRPNSRSACTAGMSGSSSAAGIPIRSRDQLRRHAPTGPKMLCADVHDS